MTEIAKAQHPGEPAIGWLSRAIDDRAVALQEVARAAEYLKGQEVVVFGSAPKPRLDDYRGEKIIACNGSACSLRALFGLKPHLSVIHAHVFYRSGPSDLGVREALEQTDALGDVLVLETPQPYDAGLLSSRASAVRRLPWLYRYEIIRRAVGIRAPFLDLSTGATAAALAFFCGAKSVKLVGISISSKGHSYNDANQYRNHVVSDVALYALMGARGLAIASNDQMLDTILVKKIE